MPSVPSSRLVGAILLLTALSVCSLTLTPAPVPTATPERPLSVTLRQLVDDEAKYAGPQVQLTGTVRLECTSGCWFFLEDGGAIIYIDLNASGLHIPQRVGSRVVLIGETSGSGGTLRILADEVHFPE